MSNLRRLRTGLRIVAAWSVLAAILACGGGDDSDGDDNSGGGGANSFMVRPGFTPDPRTATGEAGGPFSASTRNSACNGHIGAVSDHTLHVTSAFTNLRVIVSSAQDTTLVIQLSNGTYLCNDDSEGFNPIVQGAFPAGIHRIYVGTYSANTTAPYTIGITESPTVTAAQIGGGPAAPPGVVPPPTTPTPAVAVPNTTTAISLTPGFMPDPNIQTAVAGGTVQAMTFTSNGAGCRGNLPSNPQFAFTAAGNFPNLRVMANSATDTTLVIRTPDGQFRCNDDSAGFNPMVDGPFPAGTYQVFIGTYGSRPPAPVTVGFSELPSVTAATIGQ
ncbi:MAG: hypothetical protein AB8I08_22340 [Sandaracinaceae bacterium]